MRQISSASLVLLTLGLAACGPQEEVAGATEALGPAPTTTVLSDGFEQGGWSTALVQGNLGTWSLSSAGLFPSAAPHGGALLADFDSYSASTGNVTRLYRQATFALPSSFTAVALTFWMFHDDGYPGADDQVQAQVSIDGSTWTSVGPPVSRYSSTTGWTQASVDLSAYRGQTKVQIGFVGISAYGDDLYLDDVAVVAQGLPPPTYSVAGTVTRGGVPMGGVTVAVGGATAQTDANGAYRLTGLEVGTYRVTPVLAGFAFAPASRWVTLGGGSVANFDFTAASTGPAIILNDGFEAGGWSSVQVAGAAGAWGVSGIGYYPKTSPHGGAAMADFDSYMASEGNQARLSRTAGLTIASAYEKVTLGFWLFQDVGYAGYDDRVQPQISVDGVTWVDVGPAFSRYSTTTTGWTQATVDLTAFRGKASVQIGFLGISAYGNDVYLDDLTVVAN